MTPLLVLVYHVPILVAVGTDLLFASVTKSVGACAHTRLGNVDWRIVGLLSAGSVPAALASIAVLERSLLLDEQLEHVLGLFLGFSLALTAACLLIGLYRRLRAPRLRWDGRISRIRAVLTVGLGAALGVLVSLTSIGAGALGVVALGLLYPRLELKRLVGTDIAHAVPLTAIAGMGHWHLGSVDWALLVALLLGSLPGICLGSRLGDSLPETITRPLLAGLLLFVGVKLVA